MTLDGSLHSIDEFMMSHTMLRVMYAEKFLLLKISSKNIPDGMFEIPKKNVLYAHKNFFIKMSQDTPR